MQPTFSRAQKTALQMIIECEDICIHVNAEQRAILEEEEVFSKQVERQCEPSKYISQSLSLATLSLTQ